MKILIETELEAKIPNTACLYEHKLIQQKKKKKINNSIYNELSNNNKLNNCVKSCDAAGRTTKTKGFSDCVNSEGDAGSRKTFTEFAYFFSP